MQSFVLPGRAEYHCLDTDNSTEERDRRLLSVQPMVTKKVLAWSRRLSPRDLAQFDVDDASQEVWSALIQKYPSYKPEYAFTTFATQVIDQRLIDLYPRTKLVGPKRHPLKTLAIAEAEEDANEVEAITRSLHGVTSLDPGAPGLSSESDSSRDRSEQHEDMEAARIQVEYAAGSLSSGILASVLAWEFGLFGARVLKCREIADELRVSVAKVVSLKKTALREMREILLSRPLRP